MEVREFNEFCLSGTHCPFDGDQARSNWQVAREEIDGSAVASAFALKITVFINAEIVRLEPLWFLLTREGKAGRGRRNCFRLPPGSPPLP